MNAIASGLDPISSDEVETEIAAGVAALDTAINSYGQHDELRIALEAQRAVTAAQLEMWRGLRRLNAGPRPPVPEEDMAALVNACRRAADLQLAARSNQQKWWLVGGASVLGLCCACLVGYGGYMIGRAPQQVIEGASDWAALIANNDIQKSLSQCTGERVFVDRSTGRNACTVPLYVEAPKPTRR